MKLEAPGLTLTDGLQDGEDPFVVRSMANGRRMA
jgi:hypothetical protein